MSLPLPYVPEHAAHVTDWQHYQKLWAEYQQTQKAEQEKQYEQCLKQHEGTSHEVRRKTLHLAL